MTDAQLLAKHGWRELTRKRYGCVLKVWWENPWTGEQLQQGYAARIVRAESRTKKRPKKRTTA